MKINKLNIKMLTLALGLVAFTSCKDDDLNGLDPQPKGTATTTTTSLMLLEGETGYIDFEISQAINKASQFKILVVGGDALIGEDFVAGDQPIDFDSGIPGSGFEQTVPAYATSFSIPVETFRDADQTEGTRTVTLDISATGVRTILTPQTYRVEVTITDYEFCFWTLEMTDTYGDGWNGGFITVTADGASTDYACEDLDGEVNIPETQIVPVQIGNGSDFSITYTSGGGTGAGPGWESENEYVVTAPDGTEYADGPVPTEGVIVEGVNNCN